MFAQKDAIIRLLRDDDPETVRMVKEQLAQSGEEAVSSLQELIALDDESVSKHAREVLATINGRNAEEEFSLLCHFFNESTDLERAIWMLSRAIEPEICATPYEHKVNHWGRQFLMRLSGIVSVRERVQALTDFMAGELCFRGNSEHYYSEKNSLLPFVIETRMGIPITLTVLYTLVAERAAMKIDGINLPGHFIARHGDIYFDPFHRGRILTKADCEEILNRQNLKLKACHLQAATPRQMLTRVLANLLYVYDLQQAKEKHALVNSWIKALSH